MSEQKRRARFWRLRRLSGGWAPTTNGLGENAGWTFTLINSPRWSVQVHRVSRVQAEHEARRRANRATLTPDERADVSEGLHYERSGEPSMTCICGQPWVCPYWFDAALTSAGLDDA